MAIRIRNGNPGLLCLAITIGLAIVTVALEPGTANADAKRGVLAPPGPCAERRVAAAGADMSEFSVVGPVTALFSPVDVAARPAVARPAPPASAVLVRPGPCDQPGTGCGLVSVPRSEVNPPVRPGRRP